MAQKENSSKAKQIRLLLGTLASGLGAGILIAFLLLYYYNPAGSYRAKNVLLDADNAYSLQFSEKGSKTKSEIRYAFDGVYFSYFDFQMEQPKTILISKEKYAKFYHLIANQNSEIHPSSEIQSLFEQPHLAKLVVKVSVNTEDLGKRTALDFSEVDFVNGANYYRVELRQSSHGPSPHDSRWAYFYHPNIYQEAFNIFN